MNKWVMYFDGGVEEFATQAEALAAAQDAIDNCRDDVEWPDEVENIFVAKVTHRSGRSMEISKHDLDEDGCYNGKYYPPGCEMYCDYEMREVTNAST